MDDSLLVALRSYRARPGRDAREDFITTSFAWTLQAVPGLGDAFLRYINAKADVDALSADEYAVWDTHVSLDHGIADMVVDLGSRAYVFEHKVYSPASAEQVDRYRRSVDADEVVTVLITASRWNYESDPEYPDPDVVLTWSDVYTVIEDATEGEHEQDRASDFLALLKHEGLDPQDPLSESSLRAFSASRHVAGRLYALIDDVRTQCDWSFVYDMLPAVDGAPMQSTRWGKRTRSNENFNHGRIAFNIYESWRPGILPGLIVDPGDTGVELVAPERGPDLTVFIGLPRRRLGNQYRKLATSNEFRDLCQRIRDEARRRGWFVNAPDGFDPTINAHHPIVLQKPLADVLRGASTREEQRDAVYEVIREGVTLFVDGDDVNRVRALIESLLEASS